MYDIFSISFYFYFTRMLVRMCVKQNEFIYNLKKTLHHALSIEIDEVKKYLYIFQNLVSNSLK